jgi:serine/threonine-protein kinase
MAGDGESQRLGPYVVMRTSGAGGMGRIDLGLRAEADGTARLCVLKRIHAELRSRQQEARFRREANIARQLSHGAIAQTFGVEEIDGELLLVQEHVHGVDIRQLETRLATAGERVPVTTTVHIVSEVARALAHAHAFGDRGIVHRDVTPDNVMLSFAGEVKLVDFGIARSNVDATLTSSGHIVGRPRYTAPEVWEGTQADRRADIYSLGVVLWQLLTARRFEDVRAVRGEGAPPAPSMHNPEVTEQLDAVVGRALAPDPRRRFQHAGELQEALRPFLQGGFLGGPAVAALLGRHFDVARERRMLAEDVERAKRFLPVLPAGGMADGASPAPVAAPLAAAPADAAVAAASGGRRAKLVTGTVAAGVVVAVALLGLFGRPAGRPAVMASPAGEPARAAPDPEPARAAREPEPARAAPDPEPARAAREPIVRSPPSPAPHPRLVAASAGRARPLETKVGRPNAAVSADELLRRARDRFDLGETEAALALAREAATAGARAPAHVLIGKALMSERRFDEAERAFAEAVRLDPADGTAAHLLAVVRETRRGGP